MLSLFVNVFFYDHPHTALRFMFINISLKEKIFHTKL